MKTITKLPILICPKHPKMRTPSLQCIKQNIMNEEKTNGRW